MDRVIAPPLNTTPADTGGAPHPRRALPEDLLQEAKQRLGIVALLGSILWLTGTLLYHLARRAMVPDDPSWKELRLWDYVSVVNVLISAGFWAWTRRSTREPTYLIRAGLYYLLFTSLSVAVVWHSDPYMRSGQVIPTISWVGAVVVIVAAILPIEPRNMVMAGLLSVTMNPVAMLILKYTGAWDYGSVGTVVLMHYPDYLLVGVAGAISGVVTRLGHQVARARDMGSYHLGDLIGRGGMGEVYHATHRMLARRAAIKLIRASSVGGGDPEIAAVAVARFRREAEVAASLQSPHTVALYDFGVTADGTLYIVMEYLEGTDLEQLIRKEGAQPWQRVISIIRQACESLEEAHVRGLVHRDIKPANIHIGPFGLQGDFVKVLDFGLVKTIGTREKPGESLATREGLTPGTPDFMAPEMAMGETVDGRADIYALGCVAWYLLTGKPVFEAANSYHVIARHLNDAPERPSRFTTRPIPTEVEEIVLACLAKRPDERPRSAAALAFALTQVSPTPTPPAPVA